MNFNSQVVLKIGDVLGKALGGNKQNGPDQTLYKR